MKTTLESTLTTARGRVRLAAEALAGRLDAAPAPQPPAPEPPAAEPVPADLTAAPRQPAPIVDLVPQVPRAPRRVTSPVFVLTSKRSGSTLLRMLLNSHSRIRAPHELHLQTLTVGLKPEFSERSMAALDLDRAELEHVVWDRILDIELERSGKDTIVEKTPGNAWLWRRLHHAWPEARFIVLLRHPSAILTSAYVPKDPDAAERHVLRYLRPLEEARTELEHTITVRYEDLTADPEAVTRELCAWLGHEWEPGMLDYGAHDQGPDAAHMGDRSDKIRGGQVTTAREVPEGLGRVRNAELRRLAEGWGYR